MAVRDSLRCRATTTDRSGNGTECNQNTKEGRPPDVIRRAPFFLRFRERRSAVPGRPGLFSQMNVLQQGAQTGGQRFFLRKLDALLLNRLGGRFVQCLHGK